MTIDPCGPDCVAEQPMLDTADGREHDDCPEGPQAWIIFWADKDKPVLHREGLPGLTLCGGYAFAEMFGVIKMGRAHADAPVCEGCK